MKERIEEMLREGLTQAEIARRVGCSRQYVSRIRAGITIEKEPIDWNNTTIREAREAAGLTRAEMSRRFEIPIRTLESWEIERGNPPAWGKKLIIKELREIAESSELG
jgi:transcriptional regulator with XRE-family HTH domain